MMSLRDLDRSLQLLSSGIGSFKEVCQGNIFCWLTETISRENNAAMLVGKTRWQMPDSI
jgi:hypothetical protein